MVRKPLPEEALMALRQRFELRSTTRAARKHLVQETAAVYGVSTATIYRALRTQARARPLRRTDAGVPRVMAPAELERYCELIAALKVRTRNTQGHHLSTPEAIRLFENYGIDTPEGRVMAPKSLLKKSTVNRYLATWGYDQRTLAIQQPVVRFQASYANECWQFDVSPSDLKALPEQPPWIDDHRGRPVLMLYSVVDDRSGVAYQEYHVVYGEDVPAALRFLFRAMAPKAIEGFPFQGRPHVLYMDNGPIAKSQLFRRVMRYLDVEVRCHMPRGKGGRRVTSRAKGKVERPFRTVKEVHETLYHFHTPQHEEEANTWLLNFLLRYNEQPHRTEPHSRLEDWLANLPPAGIRQMCSWERFCTFARAPERRTVGPDAQVSVHGTRYQVDEELVGQAVVLWWGLFDDELFVEREGRKYGPYRPVGGPIPFDRYRAFRKTPAERRAERVEAIAVSLALPREALTTDPRAPEVLRRQLPQDVPLLAFRDPDPFDELTFPSVPAAKRAIAASLGMPLAKLSPSERETIDGIVRRTLVKAEVMTAVRAFLDGDPVSPLAEGDAHGDLA
jgi:hypothetical protein